MGNYKIKVNMEIVECADGEEAGECIVMTVILKQILISS